MVLHVEVQQESSFVSVDDSVNVILIDPDDRDEGPLNNPEFSLIGRDASNASRDHALDNTRCNTHTSILDLTRDDDEEVDDQAGGDDSSVIFLDLRESEPKRLQEDAEHPEPEAQTDQSFLGNFSPDRFFDSLCTSMHTEAPCNSCSMEIPPSVSLSSSRRSRTCPTHFSPNCMSCGQSRTDSEEQPLDVAAAKSIRTTRCSTPPTDIVPVPALARSLSTPSSERLQVETDIWNLLGCTRPPNVMELQSIWNLTTTTASSKKNSSGSSSSRKQSQPRRLARASLKTRMNRIHQLRQDRWAGATRHGITTSKNGTYSPPISLRAVSMDVLDAKDYSGWSKHPNRNADLSAASLANIMGFSSANNNASRHEKMDPHLLFMKADGYDSDPELGTVRMDEEFDAADTPSADRTLSRHQAPFQNELTEDCVDSDDQDFVVYQTVQQTLNSTWTLTWHPNAANVREFHSPPRPIMINIWMERGTVISHSGVVIEPMFMWRDAYQAHDLLQQRKRLNPTCQKPWSMRLLNTCRIAPCGNSLDNNEYPLARRANCLVLKTCQSQEFILEANSPSQMQLICQRWKLAVSRFASLAVTEDIDAIAHEFFHPTLSAQTLTVQPRSEEEEPTLVSSSSDASDMNEETSGMGSFTSWEGTRGERNAPLPAGVTIATATVIPVATSPSGRRWGDV